MLVGQKGWLLGFMLGLLGFCVMAVGVPAACWAKGVAVRVYVGAVGIYAGKVCWDSCWVFLL